MAAPAGVISSETGQAVFPILGKANSIALSDSIASLLSINKKIGGQCRARCKIDKITAGCGEDQRNSERFLHFSRNDRVTS